MLWIHIHTFVCVVLLMNLLVLKLSNHVVITLLLAHGLKILLSRQILNCHLLLALGN